MPQYPKPMAERQRRNLPKIIEVDMDDPDPDYQDDEQPASEVQPFNVYLDAPDENGEAKLSKPGRQAPPVPAELGDLDDNLKAAWTAFWEAPVAQIIDEGSDMLPAIRLFKIYKLDKQLDAALQLHLEHYLKKLAEDPDRAEEYASDKSRLDDKLLAGRLRCATEARMLEAQMGITPKSRLALGVALFVAGNAASSDHLADAHWAG